MRVPCMPESLHPAGKGRKCSWPSCTNTRPGEAGKYFREYVDLGVSGFKVSASQVLCKRITLRQIDW
jgi:hypothetical protein